MRQIRGILKASLLVLATNLGLAGQRDCDDHLEGPFPEDILSAPPGAADILIAKCGSCHFSNAHLDYSRFPFRNQALGDNLSLILKDALFRNGLPLRDSKWNTPNKLRMPPLNAPDLTEDEVLKLKEWLELLSEY